MAAPARGRAGNRGRGRGLQIQAADDLLPEPAAIPCDLLTGFFAALPAGNWPLFMIDGPPRRCRICHWEPHLHRIGEIFAAAQIPAQAIQVPARAADPFLRQGPAPALPLSPGETLRAIIADWRNGSVLPEDRERWDSLFVELSSLLFDPFSLVLLENLNVVGSTAVTRKWTVREALDDDTISRVSMALRMAKDLGKTLLNILRLEQRLKWKSQSTPLLLIDGEHELPVSIHVAESIVKASSLYVPGSRLPPSSVLSDPQNPHWWGTLAATIPIETFVATIRDFFNEYVAHWSSKPEHKGLVISSAAYRAARARRAADEAHIAATSAIIRRASAPHHHSDRVAHGAPRQQRDGGRQPSNFRTDTASASHFSAGAANGTRGGRQRGRRGRGRFQGGRDGGRDGGRAWVAPVPPAPVTIVP